MKTKLSYCQQFWIALIMVVAVVVFAISLVLGRFCDSRVDKDNRLANIVNICTYPFVVWVSILSHLIPDCLWFQQIVHEIYRRSYVFRYAFLLSCDTLYCLKTCSCEIISLSCKLRPGAVQHRLVQTWQSLQRSSYCYLIGNNEHVYSFASGTRPCDIIFFWFELTWSPGEKWHLTHLRQCGSLRGINLENFLDLKCVRVYDKDVCRCLDLHSTILDSRESLPCVWLRRKPLGLPGSGR